MRLICLVDDAGQPNSPFRKEHGLAFLVESEGGRVLFDTGPSAEVLLHNLEAAGIVPESIFAVALSHAHRDHTGGLPALLEQRPGLPIFAHPDLLQERFRRRGGKTKSVGLPCDRQILRQRADLRLSREPQEILPGIWTSGEISERVELEGRSSHHFVRAGGSWSPDPYRDDMALMLEGSQGPVLVCGCCHAGLLNTLLHLRRVFGQDPVAVVGGMHLGSADEAHLQRLVEALGRFGPPALYPNHCTGQAAYKSLARAFGQRVAPCPAGTVLEF